jgi:uncharacterized membrane protein
MDIPTYVELFNAFLGLVIVLLGLAAANKYAGSKRIKIAALNFSLIGLAIILKELTGAAAGAKLVAISDMLYNVLESFILLIVITAMYFAYKRLSVTEVIGNEKIQTKKKYSKYSRKR